MEQQASVSEDFIGLDRWCQTPVDILVPTREQSQAGNGQRFTIEGLYHQSILDIIRNVFAEASLKWFHLTPFKKVGALLSLGSTFSYMNLKVWRSPLNGQVQWVYDELYTSDAWNEAHDEIIRQKRSDGCQLERVVAGLMFWSDSMWLAQIGHVSAWPIYLYFGNLSKYCRQTPLGGVCQPIAFIPLVGIHQAIQEDFADM